MNWKATLVALTPPRWQPVWERLDRSPLGRRLARGAFWSVLGGAISRGLGLVATILVARILKISVFGDLAMVQSTVGMFGVFAGIGLGTTATKHVAEYRLKDPARAGRIIALSSQVAMVMSVVMGLAMYLAAPWLARATLDLPHLTDSLRIAAVLLFLSGVGGAQTGALAGLEAFQTIAAMNTITGIVSFPLLLAGTWWRGLEGSVWAMSATAGVGCVVNHFALKREMARAGLPAVSPWDRSDLPVLWQFTVPALLATMMVGPVQWICNAMLLHQPDGRAKLGAFSGANAWFAALMFLPTLMGQSLLPMMAERLGATGRRQGLELLKLSMKLNALLAIPVLILSCASPWLMGLFGHAFRGEAVTLVVVLATAALLAVQVPVGQLIIASGNIWPGLWMNVGWAIVYLVASAGLVRYGALGLAAARLLAYAAHAVWTLWYALRLLRTERDAPSS